MDEEQKIEQTKFLLQFIAAGTRVLSARIALVMAMVLTSLLFMWAMVSPDVWRFADATVFALLVFLPAVWLDSRAVT